MHDGLSYQLDIHGGSQQPHFMKKVRYNISVCMSMNGERVLLGTRDLRSRSDAVYMCSATQTIHHWGMGAHVGLCYAS